MRTSMMRVGVAAVCAGLFMLALHGSALPAEPPQQGADADSDPLPEGAVARLGFGKFRAAGATDVVFSPDGKYLAAKTYSDIIHVWDVKTGRSVRKFTLESSRQMRFGKQGLIPDASRFSFSADSKTLVAYVNALDRAWQRNVETGAEEKLPGDLSAKALCALQYSADGKALVAIHDDCSVKLHDPNSGSGSIAFSEDSKFLASGDRYGAVEVWRVESGKRVGRHEGHNDHISSAAFSPEGARLITGSADGIAIIWDFAKLTAGWNPSPK